MAIKVIVNYPEDPKVWEEIRMNQAKFFLNCLREKLGDEKLDELIKRLKAKENIS